MVTLYRLLDFPIRRLAPIVVSPPRTVQAPFMAAGRMRQDFDQRRELWRQRGRRRGKTKFPPTSRAASICGGYNCGS